MTHNITQNIVEFSENILQREFCKINFVLGVKFVCALYRKARPRGKLADNDRSTQQIAPKHLPTIAPANS